MKIIVISDTHEYYRNLETIVLQQSDADMFIHLGDGESETRLFLQNNPVFADRFRYIKGNCDYGSSAPLSQVIDAGGGHRIFATHGHRYQVSLTLDPLMDTARENDCDIALYGHTHASRCFYKDGVFVMNPGSATCPRDGNPPSYGILEVSDAGVMTNVVFLQKKTAF